jgi:hypothetical protein
VGLVKFVENENGNPVIFICSNERETAESPRPFENLRNFSSKRIAQINQ